MSITIRLEKELDEFVTNESKIEGITKSALIRNCIKNYYHQIIKKKTPYELGKEYFGRFDSGNPNLVKDRKKVVKEKIHEKKGSN